MTLDQINKLLSGNFFPEETSRKELVETHISWVIICDKFVYKVKKPIKYSFLDFTSLALRKHFCEREIILNRRLTQDVYLEVVPVREYQQIISLGGAEGDIIDYAVKMNKLKEEKRMDKLLAKNEVSPENIKKLAEKIALFHKNTTIIYQKDLLDIKEEYNDLETVKEYLDREAGQGYGDLIDRAVKFSDAFLNRHKNLIATRLKDGFYRDGHGDLHSRNIFLLPEPVPFDCIEFNDDFRQIDVLNEVAFLCMDLDAYDQRDLSNLFLESYNYFFPTMNTPEEQDLFIYYKSYRANIRAKVNSLRAGSTSSEAEKSHALTVTKKYLSLMNDYLKEL